MRRVYVFAIAAAAVLSVAGISRFSVKAKPPVARSSAGEGQPVAVAVARREPLSQSVTLSGAFKPFQEVDVHAKVAGYIRKMYVDVGDKVKEGQTLAVLEVPELNAQLQGADAAVRRSEDAIRQRESEIESAKSVHAAAHFAYTRLKQASETRPGLIAEQELDDSMAKDKEAEARIEVAMAALSEAKSQLAVAQANQLQVKALAAYTRITAPFDGVITKRYADTGALIQAGTSSNTQAMPAVSIAENNRLRLVLSVPESAVPDVHLGSIVDVKVPALHRSFKGKVARFADALDEQTRTMETEVDVKNRDGRLVDGMYAEVNLVLQHKAATLSVPIQAVTRNGDEASVLIVNPQNRLEERQVTLGAEGTDRIEVVSGLAENDRVVIGSRSQFQPGQKVQPKPFEQAANSREI